MTLLKYFPQKQKKNMKKNIILCFPYIKNIHQLTTSFITNIMSIVQIIILQHFCFFIKLNIIYTKTSYISLLRYIS